jgi:predicted dehydrogenase
MQKFRWAIVGTGEVAGKFTIALRSLVGAEASLVASRSAERAAAFAAKLGIKNSVGNYEAAARANVDAVYVATPPSEHRDHALLFIAAGKAVLIEKPLATNEDDAQAIVHSARAAGVFCMEGMWTRFLPAMGVARALIDDGKIGVPRSLAAEFAIANEVDPMSPLFRADLGGGATLDRAIYPISLAFDLLGSCELGAATVVMGETGVEEEVTALLRHRNNVISTIHAGLRTTGENGLSILGTEGALRFVGPIYRPLV